MAIVKYCPDCGWSGHVISNCPHCGIELLVYPEAIAQIRTNLTKVNTMPKETMTRRFYITTTPSQRDGKMLKLYSEALSEAQKYIENGNSDIYYIVEVKAIVRRETPKPPITITEVIG